MVISYQGENYVKVQSGSFAFLIDPSDERSFRGAAFALMTRHPAPLAKGRTDVELTALREPIWIDRPGEYEIAGVRINGYPVAAKDGLAHTAYRVALEGITLAFLGHLTALPEQKTIGALAGADILFVPGGGKPWLPESDAAKLVRQLEPGIVVPTLLTKKTCDAFMRELGAKVESPAEKLVVKKKDIAAGAMKIAYLAA